jgi:hypothetical protein
LFSEVKADLFCPFCGEPVIKKCFHGVTMFECNNPECRACVSFGGNKSVAPGITEAENPVVNFKRRATA